MGDMSGASLSISKEGDTPKTLADKIVTIGGSRSSKDLACREVVRKLRQMQGVEEMEPGVFVIIIPQVSAPVVIGSKGAQIKAIMEQSGAEINVGREAIIGMPDQPISVNGTVEQVVAAVSGINSVLQDMVDRGKLDLHKDFSYQPGNDTGGSCATADLAWLPADAVSMQLKRGFKPARGYHQTCESRISCFSKTMREVS
ncbi:NOVA1 [Symbiodinium pilosum]|uniref:NOVA1 protein n=1 Tax=Symbiodinium pilosum TaxID=2952 RepID=A0A812WNF1_SYMPI|nr:NOVA1 [Symbiodinium pilosum]